MAIVNALDRYRHFDEFNEPLDTQMGVLSAAKRRQRAAANMGAGASYNGSAPASIATAGNVTYTAAQLLSGVIVRDPAGASRTDVLPTAALLVAEMSDPKVGQMVDCLVVNGADAAETITFTAGTGGAFDANQTAASRLVGQNASKLIRIRITGVSSPAYVAYT